MNGLVRVLCLVIYRVVPGGVSLSSMKALRNSALTSCITRRDVAMTICVTSNEYFNHKL